MSISKAIFASYENVLGYVQILSKSNAEKSCNKTIRFDNVPWLYKRIADNGYIIHQKTLC